MGSGGSGFDRTDWINSITQHKAPCARKGGTGVSYHGESGERKEKQMPRHREWLTGEGNLGEKMPRGLGV